MLTVRGCSRLLLRDRTGVLRYRRDRGRPCGTPESLSGCAMLRRAPTTVIVTGDRDDEEGPVARRRRVRLRLVAAGP
jgi:hypothetical protein